MRDDDDRYLSWIDPGPRQQPSRRLLPVEILAEAAANDRRPQEVE